VLRLLLLLFALLRLLLLLFALLRLLLLLFELLLRELLLRELLLRELLLRAELLRELLFLAPPFFAGTLPPALRASDSPIAIACLRLFTVLPERPLFNLPRLRSCIAFSTFSDAFLPYLAMGPPRLRVTRAATARGVPIPVRARAVRPVLLRGRRRSTSLLCAGLKTKGDWTDGEEADGEEGCRPQGQGCES
jgi:hypothetical protein